MEGGCREETFLILMSQKKVSVFSTDRPVRSMVILMSSNSRVLRGEDPLGPRSCYEEGKRLERLCARLIVTSMG